MAKNKNEREEKKSNPLFGAAKVALGVGIAYKGAKTFGPKLTVAKARIGMNENLNSFKNELSAVTSATVDTIGGGSQGFLKQPASLFKYATTDTSEQFAKNIRRKQQEFLKKSTSEQPQTLKNLAGALNREKENSLHASRNSTLIHLSEKFESKEFQSQFGATNTENAFELLKQKKNKSLLTLNPKVDKDDFSLRVDSFLKENSKHHQKSKGNRISLDYDYKNKEEHNKMVDLFTNAILDSREKTKQEFLDSKDDFNSLINKTKKKSTKTNHYQNQMNYTEAIDAIGIRETMKYDPKKVTLKERAMESKGYSQVTIEDALNFKLSNGKTVGENYSHSKLSVGEISKTEENLAIKYRRRMMEAGYKEEDVLTDIFSKELFLNKETGDLLDTSQWERLSNDIATFSQDNFQIPIININPHDLTKLRQRNMSNKNPIINVNTIGELTPSFLDTANFATSEPIEIRNLNSKSKILDEDLITSGSKIYGGLTEELAGKSLKEIRSMIEDNESYILADNVKTIGVYTGLNKQFAEVSSGRTNVPLDKQSGVFKNLFGLGQETETTLSRAKRAIDKFDDPFYSGNLLDTLADGYNNHNEEDFSYAQKRIHSLLDRNTRDLSSSSREPLYDEFNAIFKKAYNVDVDLYDMTTDDGILEVAQTITSSLDRNKVISDKSSLSDKVRNNLEVNLSNKFQYAYGDNSDLYLNSKRFIKDDSIVESVVFNAMSMEIEPSITGAEDMKRAIEQLAVGLGDNLGNDKETLIRKAIKNNSYNDLFEEELYNLDALNKMSYFNKALNTDNSSDFSKSAVALKDFLNENMDDTINIHNSLKTKEGFFSVGRGDNEFEPLLQNARYQPIKESKSLLTHINENIIEDSTKYTENETLNNLLDVTKGVFSWTADTAKQYTGGNQNFNNLTDKTLHSWFFASRLNTAVSKVGLGLPNHMMNSAQSIYGNQFLRKIVMPYVAFQQLKYFDGLTGDTVSDGAADTYVNMHEDMARTKEFLGINKIQDYFKDVMPWSDQIEALPIIKGFNAATLGLFNDTRSGDEVHKDYESGETAIRKSRFWGLGSNSMYMGDKIDRFEPNWYRKMKSDYQFTDTMYGSEKEYWANNWMPTLTNPLAPIRHFITDPYHYEDKHKDDRPYAVTGGFAELQQIPIIGPVVDSAVSTVLKPRRVNKKLKGAHNEYLKAYNESLIEDYVSMNTGGVIEGKPGGAYSFVPNGVTANIYDEDGNIDEEELADYQPKPGRETYINSVMGMTPSLYNSSGEINTYNTDTGLVIGKTTDNTFSKDSPKGNSASRDALTIMNRNLTDSTSQRATKVSMAGNIEDASIVRDLSSVTDVNSITNLDGPLRQTAMNFSEIAGMYGFLTKTGLGLDEKNPNVMLQSSSQFDSYSRKFWDMELGGLGNDLSEIFRRYVPRDPNNRNYYNPIKNEMPDWLPGQDYFTDFQTGDPYSKIAKGEIRLPGESYESLYGVKKDAEGNYSAFDRFRILSDVAPYSDQYKVAKKEMSILNSNEMLSEEEKEEYKEIREQTKARKKKMHLYPNKFRNAEIKKEKVTVSKIIDANTFLTEEYGNNPIKLAGVGIKSTDTESIEWLSQFIKPGQKLNVGLDADAHARVRKDMMGTMRGIVYAPHSEKGSAFGLLGAGSGSNLNYILSQKSEENGGKVSIKNDGSAVATQALFSDGQITMGKVSEWVTHDMLPSLPIVGMFSDKFLQVRSPLEAYEKELYSKKWRDWKNPISDWLVPMMDTMTKHNPLVATGLGYGVGLLAGRKNKHLTGAIMGLATGVLSGNRVVSDAKSRLLGNGDVWIPERREKERDVDEYFDKLKYIKYHGLYEEAKRMALKKEDIDLDSYFDEQEKRGKKNKSIKSYLENRKKWLTIDKKAGKGNQEFIKSELSSIKENLEEIDTDRPSVPVGSYASLALRYKDEFETTLYGASETNDFRKIYAALPSKDKQFFTEFAKASPKERQKILKLVPKNQKRIYQQQWGMDVDERESLNDYFDSHLLPDNNWEGWNPSESLDNVKVKVMKKAGIELTEANYWDDDVSRAEQSGAKAVNYNKPSVSQKLDLGALSNALRGYGLKNVVVTMNSTPANENSFDTYMNLEKDRQQEVERGLRDEMMT